MGIKVYIKTDNDIFKVPRIDEYRYAGLERCIEYISSEAQEELKKLLGIEKLEFRFKDRETKIQSVEDKMDDICKLLRKNNILFSKHNDGFEQDLIDYLNMNPKNNISDEAISFLKQAKLKNLHTFINEYNVDIKICSSNMKSVLVCFLYE